MSNRTQSERASEVSETSGVYAYLRRQYHIPALVAAVVFMFYVRFQNYGVFMGDGLSLQAVDSWYHWRTTEWIVENYPALPLVDPWTSFPEGHLPGQFGTIFDFIVATVAMIIGLGDPSQSQILFAALTTVPAMAALVAVPAFYMGQRIGGTLGGLTGVAVLALAPGTFLGRTTAGQLQHHVAEVLFMSVAVLAMMVALRTAEEDRPIYELVKAREWDELRRPTIYGVLAGFATLLYILSWPPGVVLVGIFGVFFVIQLTLDFVEGRSPDHVAYVGVVSMLVVSVGTILVIQESGFSATGFDFFQPTFPLLVAAGCVFMAVLARQWHEFDFDPRGYPVAIAGSIVFAIAALALVLPDVYSTLTSNLFGRIVPIGHSPSALTVQEIQPPENPTQHFFAEFGLAFYTALIGIVLLLARPLLGRERRAEHHLVIVWSLFLISMALTQVRFSYYLVVAVAVLNAPVISIVVRWIDVPSQVNGLRDIESHQIIVLALVVMMLFMPLLPPFATATAVEAGGNTGPHPDSVAWEDSNEWLQENTPEPGNWGDADNADQLDYHGYYEFGEDGTFDYPEGAYGVLSWWDYGHLINVQGERMAHSNPFQSHARSSSAFLTSQSEERAELIMDAIAAGEEPREESNEELREIVDGSDAEDEIRYVMIDDQMVAGKFGAIATWTGPDYEYYVTPEDFEPNEQVPREEVEERFSELPYDDTTIAKLYFEDASGMEHYRLVHENDARTTGFVSYAIINAETGNVLIENGDPQVVVNRMYDQRTQNYFEYLQDHPQFDVEVFDERVGSAVKTYERVEGATIAGTVDDEDVIADENATVTALAGLETGAEHGQSIYEQETELEDDGSFELTVPYATNDELGVGDGYTNSSVQTTGEYAVSVEWGGHQGLGTVQYRGQTDVPETAVIEGETIEVDLEEVQAVDSDDVEIGDSEVEEGETTDDED